MLTRRDSDASIDDEQLPYRHTIARRDAHEVAADPPSFRAQVDLVRAGRLLDAIPWQRAPATEDVVDVEAHALVSREREPDPRATAHGIWSDGKLNAREFPWMIRHRQDCRVEHRESALRLVGDLIEWTTHVDRRPVDGD